MTPNPPAAACLPTDAPLLLCGAFGSFDRATGIIASTTRATRWVAPTLMNHD
jgi:hypothetical protein